MKPLIAAVILAACPVVLRAGDAWESLREQLYPDQFLLDGKGIIAIDAPYRTENDARTNLAVHVAAPDDTQIAGVTLILDENPMPVSAAFRFSEPLPRFFFDITMRLNGPTPMHVVAAMEDGRMFVSETFVKTTGQGACSAPPGTDPKMALETLGRMKIDLAGRVTFDNGDGLSALNPENWLNELEIDLDHPQHSGMAMDQITMLFTPMRYIETLDIELDGNGYAEMTGSISLSENPSVTLSVPAESQNVGVTMTDTDGTVTHEEKDLTGY